MNSRKPLTQPDAIQSICSFFNSSRAFFISCNRKLVNLDHTNAKDEVAPLSNLVFRFDKTLIADSLVNYRDSYHITQNYYHAVRAVATGVFKMGPVSADAMYNGEYHS